MFQINLFRSLVINLLLGILIMTSVGAEHNAESFYDLTAKNIAGEVINFESFRNQIVLITNIAIDCGTTPQLKELENLYQKFSDNKLVILGFPSNDFNPLEDQDSQKIEQVCYAKYGVTFPVMEIVELSGVNQHPVFRYLTNVKHEKFSGPVMFNFEKFLISPKGAVAERYGSFTSPTSHRILKDINKLLSSK